MNLTKLKLITISIFVFSHFNSYAEDITHCKQGWTDVIAGKYDDAFIKFEKCISEGNLDRATLALTYRNRGLALSGSRQYELAIESYDKALSLKPHDPWKDYVNRGNALSQLKKYEEALNEYDHALKAKPNYNQAYFNRGIVYDRMKKTDLAIKEYEKAYEYGLRSKNLILMLEMHGVSKSKETQSSSIDKRIIELEDAKNISSVFKMEHQICSGNAVMTHLSKYPDSEIIESSKQIKLDNLGIIFNVPQLDEENDTVIKLFLKDKSRGVIDNYIYFSRDATDIQYAALVFTELPKGTKRKSAFKAVRIMQNEASSKSGSIVQLNELNGPHGKSLELIIPNRLGSICYPTANYRINESVEGVSTVGISRFSFVDNILIEFAIIVELPDDISEDDSYSYAQRVMNGFWTRLTKSPKTKTTLIKKDIAPFESLLELAAIQILGLHVLLAKKAYLCKELLTESEEWEKKIATNWMNKNENYHRAATALFMARAYYTADNKGIERNKTLKRFTKDYIIEPTEIYLKDFYSKNKLDKKAECKNLVHNEANGEFDITDKLDYFPIMERLLEEALKSTKKTTR